MKLVLTILLVMPIILHNACDLHYYVARDFNYITRDFHDITHNFYITRYTMRIHDHGDITWIFWRSVHNYMYFMV